MAGNLFLFTLQGRREIIHIIHILYDTAEFIKLNLVLSLSKCLPGPHAFLLVIGTDAPFTENNKGSAEESLWRESLGIHHSGVYWLGENISMPQTF